jgi:hypothetical protein
VKRNNEAANQQAEKNAHLNNNLLRSAELMNNSEKSTSDRCARRLLKGGICKKSSPKAALHAHNRKRQY